MSKALKQYAASHYDWRYGYTFRLMALRRSGVIEIRTLQLRVLTARLQHEIMYTRRAVRERGP